MRGCLKQYTEDHNSVVALLALPKMRLLVLAQAACRIRKPFRAASQLVCVSEGSKSGYGAPDSSHDHDHVNNQLGLPTRRRSATCGSLELQVAANSFKV